MFRWIHFYKPRFPPTCKGSSLPPDFLAQAMIPLTPLVAGFLGEGIFEPAMVEGGQLVRYFGWIVGTGPGSDFGLMIFLCGIDGTLIGFSGYLVRANRDVDVILLDFETQPKIENPVPAVKSPKKETNRENQNGRFGIGTSAEKPNRLKSLESSAYFYSCRGSQHPPP